MKKAYFVINHKKNNDRAVTSLYLQIIKKALIKNNYKCSFKFNLSEIDKKNDLLVFDECKIAFKYLMKGYNNFFIWTQGIVPEEALLQGYSKLRYYAHSIIEYIILKNAKLVFMVSNEMLSHYQKKYKLNLKGKTCVMPCFNEEAVDNVSFEDPKKYTSNTFVYLGSLSEWQCFDETLEIYKSIEKKDKKSKLYVFTKNTEEANRKIKDKKIRNFKVEFVSPEELGKKIRDIKYGFVIRKDIEVNRVATPTKLSNYISHGIIPIYSECLVSFNKYNSKEKIAISFDLQDEENSINKIIQNMKRKISKDKIEKWSKETFATYYNENKYIIDISKVIRKKRM